MAQDQSGRHYRTAFTIELRRRIFNVSHLRATSYAFHSISRSEAHPRKARRIGWVKRNPSCSLRGWMMDFAAAQPILCAGRRHVRSPRDTRRGPDMRVDRNHKDTNGAAQKPSVSGQQNTLAARTGLATSMKARSFGRMDIGNVSDVPTYGHSCHDTRRGHWLKRAKRRHPAVGLVIVELRERRRETADFGCPILSVT
jgi:hypothetical protein